MTAALAILFALSGSAHAYVIKVNAEGAPTHWTTTHIPFYVDPSHAGGLTPDEIEAAATQAADAWNQVPGITVTLDYQGLVDLTGPDAPEADVVAFDDEWQLNPKLLAMTATRTEADGSIESFDMLVNTADYTWSTTGAPDAQDLQNTLTHEFGHVLGLDHNTVDSSVTMWPSSQLGETSKRTLANDDMRGVLSLYGDSAAQALTRAGCSTVPGRTTLPFAGLFAAFAAATLRRSPTSRA